MQLFWIYETLENATTALALINAKVLEICGSGDWTTYPMQLTANPEINGVTYLYGFAKPPEIFQNGASFDLEIEHSVDWFVQEEM